MIARTICLYGATDSGKTAQAGRFARHIYESSGKITRYIGADGGDWLGILRPYVDAGIIEPWSILPLAARKQSVFGAAHRLARGEWPVPTADGKALTFGLPTDETWRRVGAYVWDSGTGLAELIEAEMKASPNMTSGKEQTFKYAVDGESMSGGSWDHIRATQDTIKRLVIYSGNLPVDRVLWTFGEHGGEEEITRKSIYGPAVVGKASTGKLPKDFGLLLHCETSLQAATTQSAIAGQPGPGYVQKRRIYYMSHPDPVTGVLYPAKPRVPPEMYPLLKAKWVGGYLEPEIIATGEMANGLDAFLAFEDSLSGKFNAATKAWKEKTDAGRQSNPATPKD